jgi:hydroxymethylpyrimidine pyrophosphatase-like HAD family hydrolase
VVSTAVATDLDGTLLRDDGTVSDRTVRALARLRGQDSAHVIVTGRPARECIGLMAAIGYRGLAICGQGAQIYDADAGRVVASTTVDIDVARAAIALLGAQVGDLLVAVGTAGLDGRVLRARGFPPAHDGQRLVPDQRALWSAPIEKVMLRHASLTGEALAATARRVCGPALTVAHSDRGLVELLPAGVDKRTGLAQAVERLGVPPDRTVAFGDMPNDISMLEWAGHAVAMGNAHPTVRAIAHEVGPTNNEDGVARLLERWLPRVTSESRCGSR